MNHRMELSTRMKMNAGLVPEGALAADIGCDHGYVSIFLAREKKCPKVIAMDINQGPLAMARENIRQAGLQEQIECRLSDGMKALLPGEVDTLLLAGMGGLLICRILQQSPEVLGGIYTLIVQAQSDLLEVRKILHKLGFFIEEEQFCREAGQDYVAIRAVRGEEAFLYTQEEYRYGRILPLRKDEGYRKYLLSELEKRQVLAEKLVKSATDKANVRVLELRQEIKEIQQLLVKYYEKAFAKYMK